MIITIDGPAGSGKSTVARQLAARLGIPYLDTGAMYRAIALKAATAGIDLRDDAAMVALAEAADVRLDCGPTQTRVLLDGQDVSEAIRTMEVSAATGFVATNQAIRQILIQKQRTIAVQLGSVVTEGRDQGSVVFPEADVRFLLEASVEKRAERRHAEITTDGKAVDLNRVIADLNDRDDRDSVQWAPLLQSGNAVRVDTSDMTLDEVVQRLYDEVERRGRRSVEPS
ncbi:MAG: (d)CMP kinase [Phycisphaerae bacterium]|nr:(d)CMP kinase [Phycisphaerae bacterium]